jgi:hypothetical protein
VEVEPDVYLAVMQVEKSMQRNAANIRRGMSAVGIEQDRIDAFFDWCDRQPKTSEERLDTYKSEKLAAAGL